MSKIIRIIISVFAGYGIYGAVMLNGSHETAAAVVEGIVAAAVIYRYIKKTTARAATHKAVK